MMIHKTKTKTRRRPRRHVSTRSCRYHNHGCTFVTSIGNEFPSFREQWIAHNKVCPGLQLKPCGWCVDDTRMDEKSLHAHRQVCRTYWLVVVRRNCTFCDRDSADVAADNIQQMRMHEAKCQLRIVTCYWCDQKHSYPLHLTHYKDCMSELCLRGRALKCAEGKMYEEIQTSLGDWAIDPGSQECQEQVHKMIPYPDRERSMAGEALIQSEILKIYLQKKSVE